MLGFKRKPSPAQAHAKAVEAYRAAKERDDRRAMHSALPEVQKALHERLRAGA